MTDFFDRDFVLLIISQTGFFISLFLVLSIIALFADDVGADESLIGLIVGVFSFAAVISRYPFGLLADKGGRKKFLLIGSFIFLVSSFLYPFGREPIFLLLIRIFHGIGIGAYMVASMSKLVDIVSLDRLGEAMGWFGVPIMVAMVIGQGGGPFLVELVGYDFTFYLAGFFALISLLTALFIEENDFSENKETNFLATLKNKDVLLSGFGTFMLTFVYGGFISFFPLFMKNCFFLGELEISIGFSSFAIASLIARPTFGKLSDSFGKIKIIVPGMLLASLGLFLLGQVNNEPGFYFPIALFGAGFGAAYAVLSALAVSSISKFDRGKATAILTSSFDFGLATGSSALGLIVVSCNFNSFFTISSLILLGGTIIFVLLKKIISNN